MHKSTPIIAMRKVAEWPSIRKTMIILMMEIQMNKVIARIRRSSIINKFLIPTKSK